jgi:hypothetical protein
MRAPTLGRSRPGAARGALCEGGHVGLGGVELRDDRIGVAEQEAPGVGQVDGAGPARTLDEPLADGALQFRDLLADGRLRVAELPGRPAEGARPRDGLEGRQMAQLDPERAITFIIEPNHNWICLMNVAGHAE